MIPEQIITALHSDTLDQFSVAEIIDILADADDLYYNGEDSFLTDAEYDAIYRYAERVAPHDVYFTGVGSEVRGGKIKLPYKMGSLDQVYEGEITGWVADKKLQNEFMLITDKLDGTSALVIYDAAGDLQIAYSRGDGIEGADITRHCRNIPSIPKKINTTAPVVVRGEMIISKHEFPNLQKIGRSRTGRPYKNARNAVAGIMNASSNDDKVYPFIHFIAYEVIGSSEHKQKQLLQLVALGFKIPPADMFKGGQLSDAMLSNYLNGRRRTSEYEIDGLVIDVDDKDIRQRLNPTRDTLNPAYAVKYKIADANNQAIATVVNVEWNPSKDNYYKPRVEIEPVELVGVTIKHATGFNAKFINDNKIGPGAKVLITRSGDVIPFIQKVIEPARIAQLPNIEYTWTDTGVDIIGLEETAEVRINQLIDFFASIDAPLLREGNIRTLYEAGFDTTESIIKMSSRELERLIGSNGKKIYDGLREKLSSIPLYVLMGSTNFFGRGVGRRKIKKLIQALGEDKVRSLTLKDVGIITLVEGFEEKTAQKIVAGMDPFREWLDDLSDLIGIEEPPKAVGSKLTNEKVVFTGFRDGALEKAVEAAGGAMQSSVSGKTTIVVTVDPNSNSGKIKKARDLGIKIMGVDEFRKLVK